MASSSSSSNKRLSFLILSGCWMWWMVALTSVDAFSLPTRRRTPRSVSHHRRQSSTLAAAAYSAFSTSQSSKIPKTVVSRGVQFASSAGKSTTSTSTTTSTTGSGIWKSLTNIWDTTNISTKIKEISSAIQQRLPIPISKLALWTVGLGALIWLQRNAISTGRYWHEHSQIERWRRQLFPIKEEEKEDSDQRSLPKDFDDTLIYTVSKHVQTMARMGTYLYGTHVVVSVLQELLQTSSSILLPPGWLVNFSKTVYTVWAATRLHVYKRFGIGKLLHRDPDQLGKAGIYNTIAAIILWLWTASIVASIWNLSLGSGVTTLLALSGLGTTVFALASQDLAGQVIAGLSLITSNPFEEGDTIQVGDQIITGVVTKIGWLETEIRQSHNDQITKIKNSVFLTESLTNVSRGKPSSCRVQETLAISYQSMSQIPTLVQDIKSKIIDYCPTVIVDDASRPLIVNWNGFDTHHLKVIIDARFADIPPTGEEYYANKQRMMEAIAAAVVDNNIVFAAAAAAPATPNPPPTST